MIIVKQLQRKDIDQFIDNEDGTGNKRREARSKVNTALPSLITAYYEDDPSTYTTWGFRSRRTSHVAEVTWWSGNNEELRKNALIGCIYTAILEGRKRVEIFDEHGFTIPSPFLREGFHPYYTDKLEDVTIWGHVWVEDGIPVLQDTKFTLYNNTTVQKYLQKNQDLYEKDRDLYREDSEGKTFKQRIEEANATIRHLPGVEVVDQPGWHGNEQKSE